MEGRSSTFLVHAPLTIWRATLSRRAGRSTKTFRSEWFERMRGGAARLRPFSLVEELITRVVNRHQFRELVCVLRRTFRFPSRFFGRCYRICLKLMLHEVHR